MRKTHEHPQGCAKCDDCGRNNADPQKGYCEQCNRKHEWIFRAGHKLLNQRRKNVVS